MLKNNRNGIVTLGFELLDTGRSFDKASLKKIFGDFVNIESKEDKEMMNRISELFLSRQLVELMGGELQQQPVRYIR